jgi:hypothetical protein
MSSGSEILTFSKSFPKKDINNNIYFLTIRVIKVWNLPFFSKLISNLVS